MEMKKHMIGWILLLLLFISNNSTYAQDDVTVILWHTDGTTTECSLGAHPKIVFDNETVVVVCDGSRMEFPSSEIRRMSYKGKGTGIREEQNVPVLRQGDRIFVSCAGNTEAPSVHTVSGMKVEAETSTTERGAWISLAGLPKGIYIITVNGNSIKYTKP